MKDIKSGSRGVLYELGKNRALYLMCLPAILIVLIMQYIPMSGVILAFKNFRYNLGIFSSPWCGLDNFKFFFASGTGMRVTVNTILYNLLNISTSQIMAIIIAIFITELSGKKFRKMTQSIIFLPYFVSWVLVGTFVYNIFSYDYGVANNLRVSFGLDKANFYNMQYIWPWVICFFNSWKWVGYTSVIYIASITGIDPQCYEAADIDGANIWQKTVYITFPGITPTMITLLLLSIGRILRGDFQMFYQIVGNNGNLYNTTDVIDTYVFRALTQSGNIGMTAAATFYQSILCFIIIMLVNGLSRKINREYALF